MIERKDPGGNVYTVEPLNGQGKGGNRTELLDTKPMALMVMQWLKGMIEPNPRMRLGRQQHLLMKESMKWASA